MPLLRGAKPSRLAAAMPHQVDSSIVRFGDCVTAEEAFAKATGEHRIAGREVCGYFRYNSTLRMFIMVPTDPGHSGQMTTKQEK